MSEVLDSSNPLGRAGTVEASVVYDACGEPAAAAPSSIQPRGKRGWILRRMLLAADAVGLLLALVLTSVLERGGIHSIATVEFADRLLALVLLLPLFVVVAKLYGLYDRDDERAHHSTLDESVTLVHLVTLGVWTVVSVGILIGRVTLSRTWIVFWLLTIVSVAAMRAATRIVILRSPRYLQNTIIVGTNHTALVVAQKILRLKSCGIRLVGFVEDTDGAYGNGGRHSKVRILGDLSEVLRLVDEHAVDRVIITFDISTDGRGESVVRQLIERNVRVDVVPRLIGLIGPNAHLHVIEGLPLVGLPPSRLSRSSLFLKRLTDLVVAASLLVILAPLFAVVGVAIKLTSRGPVFFRQLRIGSEHRPFFIYKFRTMVADAESRKGDLRHLNKHLASGGDPRMFKIAGDPRTTTVGGVLRRFSIDELPQLLNVLRGEMSMVGPRPLIPDEDQFVSHWARKRLDLKPGITGLWQVLGRSAIPFEEMVKLDYLYVTGWSLSTDLKLMAQTIPAILRSRDAY